MLHQGGGCCGSKCSGRGFVVRCQGRTGLAHQTRPRESRAEAGGWGPTQSERVACLPAKLAAPSAQYVVKVAERLFWWCRVGWNVLRKVQWYKGWMQCCYVGETSLRKRVAAPTPLRARPYGANLKIMRDIDCNHRPPGREPLDRPTLTQAVESIK